MRILQSISIFVLPLFLMTACLSTDSPINSGTDGSEGGGDATCIHTGTGDDYPVGPGQKYPSISDVPWDKLGPGDTVRIHYRETPYREKIVIRTDGTEQNPIRVCGVAGPNGERPILDGDGAVNDPDDADASKVSISEM